MRDIKFRAWIKSAETMVNVTCIDWEGEYIVHDDLSVPSISALEPPEPERTTEMNDCALMQYSGLKDISGKDVYEGDVLRVTMYVGDDAKEDVEVGVVVFDGGAFQCTADGMNVDYYHDIEIIGNIYETPD